MKEKFNKNNGTEFDLKKYNKYQKGTSGYNIFARTAALLPWTETYRAIKEVEDNQAKAATKAAITKSEKAAQNINNITDTSALMKDYSNASYDPNQNSKYKISDLRKLSGGGSLLNLGNDRIYLGGKSGNIKLPNRFTDINTNIKANFTN